MKQTKARRLYVVVAALLLAAVFAFALSACGLKDAIDDLQQEVSGTGPQPGEKTVTVYVDDHAILAVTDKDYFADLLQELYGQGVITVLDAPDGPYGLTIKKVECRVTETVNGESVTKVYSVSDDAPNTYVAIYHTVDNPDLKGTDYVTGAVIEQEAFGKTFWYSTLGAASLPLYDGACYRLVAETY